MQRLLKNIQYNNYYALTIAIVMDCVCYRIVRRLVRSNQSVSILTTSTIIVIGNGYYINTSILFYNNNVIITQSCALTYQTWPSSSACQSTRSIVMNTPDKRISSAES